MNRKYVIYLALAAFITAIILFNNKEVITSSHKSGFYLKPFKLSLTTNKKYTIHYTVDGSSPTNKSTIFQNQITITGKESYDSLSFINTTIPDSIANFGWREPIKKQDKATIIKYAAFQNDSIITDIKTLCFFLGDNWDYNFLPNTKENKILNKINSKREHWGALRGSINTKYKLPVISISTDKANLYDKEKGLFIAGDNFKTNKVNSGNYFQRGINFEREVYFQYFNYEGKLSFEMELGMRIHGGITRRNPQKSLKFYARKEYGNTKINFPFLSEKGVNRFILESMQESGGGQALIEDIVAQEIVKEIGLEQQTFQAVIVFINGEYWGLHTIRDKIDENYLSYKFNLHKDSFDIIDGNPSKGYEEIYGSNSDYIKLLNFVKNNDLSINKNYNHVTKELDIDNFIDYYSVEIFFANNDWPMHNIKMWKKKNGKWRYLLYDLDAGFTGNSRDYTFNMFRRLSNPPQDKVEKWDPVTNQLKVRSSEGYIKWHKKTLGDATLLFRELMKNKLFKDKFILRYKEIISLYMQPKKTIAITDSISKIYSTNMKSHINRWRYPWSIKHHWKKDIEKNIITFLQNREEFTLKNLDAYIGNKNSNQKKYMNDY